MTAASQKRLAVAAAVTVIAAFIAANAHLIFVAVQSQPDCTVAAGAMPAQRAC